MTLYAATQAHTVPALQPSTTVSALLAAVHRQPRLSSSCEAFDELLTPTTATQTRGLALGSLLELIGPPGAAKSRVCLGFVLAERFRQVAQGTPKQGQVLVLDAEGSLLPNLLRETAELFAEHHGHGPEAARQACDGMHYRRIYDVSLLVACLYSLPSWLDENSGVCIGFVTLSKQKAQLIKLIGQVQLIVLDALTSQLQPTSLDHKTRNFIFELIKSTLTLITSQHNVAVILTSNTSLKLYTPDGAPCGFSVEAEALLTPQLGTSWIPQSVSSYRVVLYFDDDGERHAHLLSATTSTRVKQAAFTVDALGPCDHPSKA
ncbi:hypothetical protein OIV83_004390 [Microbotryomycetes sp. JL201]|nr:hypothetical protein OIV83_004390 [Microbotryomycetes sp. JL201]